MTCPKSSRDITTVKKEAEHTLHFCTGALEVEGDQVLEGFVQKEDL